MGIFINALLDHFSYNVIFQYERFLKKDGSITLSLVDFDSVVNAADNKAIDSRIRDLREYAEDYYNDIKYWSSDKNRKS